MSKNVIFTDFWPPPILQKIEYAENFAKQTCVANIDEQLWYHEGLVNVKFEGSKVRKIKKRYVFLKFFIWLVAPQAIVSAAGGGKLQVAIFRKLDIVIYHLWNFYGKYFLE